jgi:hypothetical protein
MVQRSRAIAAAIALRDLINPQNKGECKIDDLAQAIDAFMFSSWDLRSDDISSIEQTDLEPERIEETASLREFFAKRFPELGLYWVALNSGMSIDENGQLAVGDALDDLIDIWKELGEVSWFLANHGEAEALAALKFRYHHHLYMHLLPLRNHLEQLIYEG